MKLKLYEGRDAQENGTFYTPKKTFGRIEVTYKMTRMLLWSTRWEYRNSWAPSQILMPTCAIHKKLATLQLQCVNYPIFVNTYMQRILSKLEIVQMWNQTVDVSIKAIFT